MIIIKNSRLRSVLRVAVPFVLIPLAAVFGTLVLGEKYHLAVSLCAALLTVLLFISGFEKKNVGTRRMVIVSIMIAFGIIGRFIPFFKPITALTVLTAVYLGPECGFTVGAFSALLSNFYFGQGPWTVFQMLAWGFIGLIAGMLSRPLQKSRVFLLVYGVLSGVVYSLVMDVWTVLWYGGGFDIGLYTAAVVTAP